MSGKRYDFIGILVLKAKFLKISHSIVMHSFSKTFHWNKNLAGLCLNNFELKPLKIQPWMFDLCQIWLKFACGSI